MAADFGERDAATPPPGNAAWACPAPRKLRPARKLSAGPVKESSRPRSYQRRAALRRPAARRVRLTRWVRTGLAAAAARARNAEAALGGPRLAEVERRLASIADDPAATVRWLRRSPEGIDALLGAFLEMKANLSHREST